MRLAFCVRNTFRTTLYVKLLLPHYCTVLDGGTLIVRLPPSPLQTLRHFCLGWLSVTDMIDWRFNFIF